jgi:hypothetical protein
MVITDRRLSLYSWWFANKMKLHPRLTTFNLSAGGLATPGMPLASLNQLLDLPVIREGLQGRMDALRHQLADLTKDPGLSRLHIESIVHDLGEELGSIAALAHSALELVRKARTAKGSELDNVLAALGGIDERLLGSNARDVVGFILESAAGLIGGRARTLAESLDKSERIYTAVHESASWHATCLATRENSEIR